MNWKLKTGQLLHAVEQGLISSNFKFINEHFPYGKDWLFDLKRILGTQVSVIIDAGANIGSICLELNRWFPKADIYAFEPILNTFNQLQKNTFNKEKIHRFHLGLGDKNETTEILLQEENTINSLKITAENSGITDKEKITITRLDQFLQEQNLTQIDILKIDVEGFEFEVLDGCGALLKADIKCIYLEVGYEREITKVHFSDVEKFMEEKGFVLCGIYETRRNLFDKRRLWYSNNLYINKKLLT
jgi:FkbM family methyltransferase